MVPVTEVTMNDFELNKLFNLPSHQFYTDYSEEVLDMLIGKITRVDTKQGIVYKYNDDGDYISYFERSGLIIDIHVQGIVQEHRTYTSAKLLQTRVNIDRKGIKRTNKWWYYDSHNRITEKHYIKEIKGIVVEHYVKYDYFIINTVKYEIKDLITDKIVSSVHHNLFTKSTK